MTDAIGLKLDDDTRLGLDPELDVEDDGRARDRHVHDGAGNLVAVHQGAARLVDDVPQVAAMLDGLDAHGDDRSCVSGLMALGEQIY